MTDAHDAPLMQEKRAHPPEPRLPLTIESLFAYIVALDEYHNGNMDNMRQLVLAMGERRTADMRAMIGQEVAKQMAVLQKSLESVIQTKMDSVSHANAPVFRFVRGQMSDELAETRRKNEHTRRVDGLMGDLRNGLVGFTGWVALYKLQPQLAIPMWSVWCAGLLILGVCVAWPLYKNLVLPVNGHSPTPPPELGEGGET